jgi:hypothetical protein
MKTNTPPKKIWVDVIKAGGINVQIVLGNSNIGLRVLMQKRGERHGGVVWRLAKRREYGERGVMGRGNVYLEKIISRGNEGGQIGKHGIGRVEEREEPSMVASM